MLTKIFIFLTCILSCICIYLSYLWLDLTITRNYELESVKTSNAAYKMSTHLLASEWHGKTENQVLKKIRNIKQYKNLDVIYKIKNGNGDLWVEGVRFEFKNFKLVSVGKKQS